MPVRELDLFVSRAAVRVRCEWPSCGPDVMNALETLWRGCREPLLAPTRRAQIDVTRTWADGDVFQIALDGELLHSTQHSRDLLPLIESVLYRLLHAGDSSCVLLHGACVCFEGRALILVGPSGSGKSSLALAAVQRGYAYLTDELTVTDGAQVWGVPRAIQFEPVRSGDVLPERLAQSDRELYPLRLEDDDQAPDAVGAVPVRAPSADELATGPYPASSACVIRVQRGKTCAVEPLSPLEALAELHEASFERPSIALGVLVGPSRAYRLTWSEPQAALSALEQALRNAPRPSLRPPA